MLGFWVYKSILTSARCEYKLLQFRTMVDKGDVEGAMVKVFLGLLLCDAQQVLSGANLS
jgi:hypothetical protein